MSFNTAVSAFMVLANHLRSSAAVPREALEGLLQLLAPFAPHVAEELWSGLGHDESISLAAWPIHDQALWWMTWLRLPSRSTERFAGRVTLPRLASDEDARRARQ